MIIIDEVLSAINSAMELAQKKDDKEVAEKLVEVYASMLKLKIENEELRNRLAEYEKAHIDAEDLVLSDQGFYYKKTDISMGKRIRYCASCYANTGKLYPITQGSMPRDFFCTNCRMHYNNWSPQGEVNG